MTRSNAQGRALESLIVTELLSLPNNTLTPRAQSAQSRDANAIASLTPTLRQSMRSAGGKTCRWLQSLPVYSTDLAVTIDRAGDQSGGTADLIITLGTSKVPLSVKHNHGALKHQRPYSLVKWFAGSASEDRSHRSRLGARCDNFRRHAGRAANFSAVPAAKDVLLREVCHDCVLTLTAIRTRSASAAELFAFLTGGRIYRLLVKTDAAGRLSSVSVEDFHGLAEPSSFRVSYQQGARNSHGLCICFNNSCDIRMRLHTASSRISSSGQLSLKFDTSFVSHPRIPTVVL
jgi:hypothetical protein